MVVLSAILYNRVKLAAGIFKWPSMDFWVMSQKISVHKHSAGVGAGIVRVRPTLKFHISGALTLRDTLRKNIL